MRKLRESVMAKIIAWLLCIASVIGSAMLGIFMLIGIEEDLLVKTREEELKSVYERINISYSIEAYRNLNNSAHAEYLRGNHFKYGIIKSNSLKGIDFHDNLSYLCTNMTDKELADMDPDQLLLYQFIASEKGSTDGEAWGYYGDYDNISALDAISNNLRDEYSTEWKYLYADRICYDVAKGIIYYRADGKYYPVQNVSLCYQGSEGQTIYNYNYDFNNKGYKLNYKSPGNGTAWDEALASVPEELLVSEENNTDTDMTESHETDSEQRDQPDSIEKILEGKGNGSMVNLSQLNDTAFNYSNWGTMILDNIRSLQGEELTLIDSDKIADGFFIDQPGYYLNENYTLVVQENIQADTYWVVSIVPEFVSENDIDNKYNQEIQLINFYYDVLDMNLFQGIGISIFMMVVSIGFLIYAAGHRKGVEGIVLTSLDRISVEIFSLLVFGVECCLLLLWEIITHEIRLYRFLYSYIGVCGLFGVLMTVIAIAYVLSISVRIKAGKWWRNSICYRIYSWIREIVINIIRNISVLWKMIVVIGIVSVIEFWFLVDTLNRYRSPIIAGWLIEKIIICFVLFVLTLQIYELQKAGKCMAEGDLSYKVNTEKMFWECRKHGENLNKIGEGMSKAVDERMKSERLKTELITNVSHDIKTPLTSIINYVDLLSKEELHNEKAAEYLEVLDRQSSKLKKLIEDLVEASKASSGNLAVDSQMLEAGVFVTQTVGEYEEKLSLAGLELIVSKPDESVYIMTDGRHVWRVIDNLMNNICKYAQANSRVYVNLETTDQSVSITFRNISKYPLNISGDELMERFVRGDKSRNTEGHGLGLSIAQSLMKLIGGDMDIIVDGDLFKVVLAFNRYQPDMQELILEKEEEDH
ncbi:MAG: sensor histidine kinase [Lachnospiraceae bacterium]|nr:sensor histidine kinase [Lachnospiraceae bacterium]